MPKRIKIDRAFWERYLRGEDDFDTYTPVQLKATIDAVKARYGHLLKKQKELPATPIDLAVYCSPEKFEHAAHIDFLSKRLVHTHRNGGSLLVTMPPRHTKTTTSVQWFTFWALIHDPTAQVIYASYEADYAAEWGAKTRALVIEHGKEFGLELDAKQSARNNWRLTTGGGMTTAGVGGPLTGRGANLLLCDDLIKNEIEATSETARERADSWVQTVALTRLEPGASCVFIGTLWHEDDILSRLIRTSNSGAGRLFEIIRLPALAEDEDPLDRAKGAALWPEKFPVHALEQIKRSMTSYHWAALYQCRPTPEGGGRIKDAWWRYYTETSVPPQFDQMLQSWDLSLKLGKGRDPVVGQVWGRSGPSYYLLDQVRGEFDLPTVIEHCRLFVKKYPKAVMKLVEDKAAGPALIQMLRRETSAVIPVNPKASKEARVEAILPLIEGGNVFLPRNHDGSLPEWIRNDFIPECRSFPKGVHDDQVDAMSQALTRLMPAGWSALDKAHGAARKQNEPIETYKDQFKKAFWESTKESVKEYEEHGRTGTRMGAVDPFFGDW